MLLELKNPLKASDTSLFTGRVPDLAHPAPESEAAHHFVRVLREASENPFCNASQRERFASTFTGLLDRFQLRIDAGVPGRVFTLQSQVIHDQDGSPVDVDVVLKSDRGMLMGSIFGGAHRLGLFDASARMQEGHYVVSDAPLIPLTQDSPSVVREQDPTLSL